MKIGDLVKRKGYDIIGVIVSISPDGRLYRVLWVNHVEHPWPYYKSSLTLVTAATEQ
tara:strand:+ start:1898 stop:2068 length:171 start_codon:yes stop_codon:yes gene_type:complete